MREGEKGGLYRRWLLSGLVIASVIFTAGCGLFVPRPPVDTHGKIVLVLTRTANTEPGRLRTTVWSELEQLSESSWPRSVADVLRVLKGYRIRVQGVGVDVMKEVIFEEGETEVTVEINVPVGNDYSVTLVAFSGENLLGAGKTTGVSVRAGETTYVEVSMQPYQYHFEAPAQVQVGATINIVYEIKGPLLSEIFVAITTRTYYFMSTPSSDAFGYHRITTGTVVGSNHWKFHITLPGQAHEGTLYYQCITHAQEWVRYVLITPSIKLGEILPTIQITNNPTGSGKIIIKPVW